MKLIEKYAELSQLRDDINAQREALEKMDVRFRGILSVRCIDTTHPDVYEARAHAVHTWDDLIREFDELDKCITWMSSCVLAHHPESQG